jgi:hypothetical protein
MSLNVFLDECNESHAVFLFLVFTNARNVTKLV